MDGDSALVESLCFDNTEVLLIPSGSSFKVLTKEPQLAAFLEKVERDAAVIRFGSYTGTGENNKTIELPGTPKLLCVFKSTGTGVVVMVKLLGIADSLNVFSGTWVIDGILDIANNKMILGLNPNVNAQGISYIWIGVF